MMRIWIFCGLLLFSLVKAENGNDVQISGTNDKCAEFCLKTYRGQDAATKSCQQGCRLYSVLQFVDKAGGGPASVAEPNSTAISVSCQHECNEAYKDAALKSACVGGCQHQTPFTTGHLKIVMDDSGPLLPFANKLMADTFGKFDDFHKSMMERLDKVKNWFQNDPFVSSPVGKIDGSEQEKNFRDFFDRVDSRFRNLLTQLTNPAPANENLEKKPAKSDASTVNPLYAYAQSLSRAGKDPIVKESRPKHVDGSEFKFGPSSAPVGNQDDNGEPIIIVKMISSNGLFDGDEQRIGAPINSDASKIWLSFTQESLNGKPYEPSPPLSSDDGTFVDAGDTWLACLARRTQSLSMLTRWLLCASLMLSILCMIYLCMAVMRANQQRRRRLYLQYKMGKSDAVFLMPPPAYEIPGELPKKDEMQPESPPPTYEIAVGPTSESVVKEV